MSENRKPLEKKDIPLAQESFSVNMADIAQYVLDNYNVPKEFQGVYIYYAELGKK
jgi:hypothetical protein